MYRNKEPIYSQGDRAETVFYVESGHGEAHGGIQARQEAVIAILIPRCRARAAREPERSRVLLEIEKARSSRVFLHPNSWTCRANQPIQIPQVTDARADHSPHRAQAQRIWHAFCSSEGALRRSPPFAPDGRPHVAPVWFILEIRQPGVHDRKRHRQRKEHPPRPPRSLHKTTSDLRLRSC